MYLLILIAVIAIALYLIIPYDEVEKTITDHKSEIDRDFRLL